MSQKTTGSDYSVPFLYWFCRGIVRVLCRSIWRCQIKGIENIPKTGPVIVAANHRSYADPPLVGQAISRGAHFLAKKQLFRFGPFGWLISHLNAHPLNRLNSREGLTHMQQLLNQGKIVILFPEGKRMKTDQLGPPKAGVGLLSMKSKVPVVPVYIHNSGHLKKLKKISVHMGSPISPHNFKSYQALANHVMEQIQKMKDHRPSQI